MEKQFDVICMGRVAVDLYSQQIGARLEDASSFAKYLGGSSGNVAYGTARQGLRSSMLARVGDEHMGRFLREELNQVGCDTSHLITDKQRLTALVLLGIKDRDTFPLIFIAITARTWRLPPAMWMKATLPPHVVLPSPGLTFLIRRPARRC
ncbi:5-dehydro-2-deoxygluconokinase [Enterobacter asburiae]|nr:5-dehydro-2-deoxygluconokinase [Enterobacter asburiae]